MASFNNLVLHDKAMIIAHHGAYVESIEWFDHWIHLYSINHHFVEIYYNINTRQIDGIIMIKYKDLDKYLDRIVIGDLQIKR